MKTAIQILDEMIRDIDTSPSYIYGRKAGKYYLEQAKERLQILEVNPPEFAEYRKIMMDGYKL